MKKLLPTMLGLLIAASINTSILFGDDNSVKGFDPSVSFEGTVTPLITTDIKAGFDDDWRGWISHVAYPGEFFTGPTKDGNGTITDRGTLILSIDQKAREGKLHQAKADFGIAKKNYERDQRLIKTNAVSKQQAEETEAIYNSALAKYNQEQYLFEYCNIYAPFDGMVIKVSNLGWMAGEPVVMQIAQLTPIGVHLKMDRTLANKITPSTPITIYPDPSISSEPFQIVRGWSILTDDGITFSILNYMIDSLTEIKGKRIPVVSNVDPVLPFRFKDKSTASVSSSSIFKDDKGQYVWLAEGQSQNKIENVFKLKKVYIELTGKAFFDQVFTGYHAIKNNKELKINDILIKDVPKNAKDGDFVSYKDQRYIFMPGDKVKVVIGEEKLLK